MVTVVVDGVGVVIVTVRIVVEKVGGVLVTDGVVEIGRAHV